VPSSCARASALLCAIVCALAPGCAALPPPTIAVEAAPRAAGHIYVTRPIQVIPEPDPFIQGVVVAFTEALVLSGYDFTGTTYDVGDQQDLLADLARRNQKIPGTVGIHLSFTEAPLIVGFGKAYTSIKCTVYDTNGRILMTGSMDPPERHTLRDLLLPPKHPDVEGRSWGKRAWDQNISFFFPPRR
jgi:hypothetical protein